MEDRAVQELRRIARNIPLVRLAARVVLFVPRELLAWLDALVRHWPGMLGFAIRRWYGRARFKHLGRNVIISPGARFFGHRYISIDDDSHIDINCIILAGPTPLAGFEVRRVPNPYFKLGDGEVSIGKGVHIAPGCLINGLGGVQIGDQCGCAAGTKIFSITNHYVSFSDRTRRDVYFSARSVPRTYIIGPVVMERNTGLALNCVALPGATVREDSFVAIGSLVRDVIPPNSLAGGTPAVRIRDRFDTRPAAGEPTAG
jgi:acetyltransferase-like isoleucine patch superfamily enzyme